MKKNSMRLIGAALALSLPTLAAAAAATASPSSPARHDVPAVMGGITVYQAKVVNQQIVLGPQSYPTVLVTTRPLPAGTYMITAVVGAVIASHDQIVCAAATSGNDGVFGTAGNPGTGGIYGTATMTDTWTVTAGQTISVRCNSFNFGKGTYAGDAVLNVVPVSHVY